MLTAVILCGGQGTRLRPVIGNLPKCLAPVAGRPFIEYILDHLQSQGVEKCFLCCNNSNSRQFYDHLGTHWNTMVLGYFYPRYTPSYVPMGSGGDLRTMLVEGTFDYSNYEDPLLIVNGDTYCKFDLNSLLAGYHEVKTYRCGVDVYGMAFGAEREMWARAGITLLSKKFLAFIPANTVANLEDFMILHREAFRRHYVNWDQIDDPNQKQSGFIDIGTPEGYAAAEGFLRDQGVIP